MSEIRKLADDAWLESSPWRIKVVRKVPLLTLLTYRMLFAAGFGSFGVVFTWIGVVGLHAVATQNLETPSMLHEIVASIAFTLFLAMGIFMLFWMVPECIINGSECTIVREGEFVRCNQMISRMGIRREKAHQSKAGEIVATVQIESGRRDTWSYFLKLRLSDREIEISQRGCGPDDDEDLNSVKREAVSLAASLVASMVFDSVEVRDSDAHLLWPHRNQSGVVQPRTPGVLHEPHGEAPRGTGADRGGRD